MPAEPNTEFIGVFMSEEMDNCLRLIALLQGVNKSTMVRNIVQQKIKDSDWTEQNLIERYAHTVYSQWSLRYKETQSFKFYLSEIKMSLIKKKIVSGDLLEEIIKKCKELNQSANK